MSNPSKQRGTESETMVVKYLRDHGFPHAERLALAGAHDKGDIRVCPGVITEVKAHREWSRGDVADWLRETDRERRRAYATIGFLVVRVPRQPVANWWAVTRVGDAPIQFSYLDEYVDNLRWCGWGTDPRG